MKDDHPQNDLSTPGRLERAVRAMRSLPASEPPADIAAGVRLAMQPASSRRAVRVAAKLAVAATVVTALSAGAYLALRPTPALAFAEVVARVEAARTLRAVVTDLSDGSQSIMIAKGPISRSDGPNYSSTTNNQTGESLYCDHDRRSADYSIHKSRKVADIVDWFRDMNQHVTKPIGTMKIGDVAAVGFEGKSKSSFDTEIAVRVWVNPQTRLPIRIETLSNNDPSKVWNVIDSIVFDAPIDESLLTLTPPEGYALSHVSTIAEKNLKPPATAEEAERLVITPLGGIGDVRFGMSREAVEAILGKPEGFAEEKADRENTRDTWTLHYPSRGLNIVVVDGFGVFEIGAFDYTNSISHGRSFPGRTDKGIRIGSSVADILKAYGEPTEHELYSNGAMEDLRYDNIALWFFAEQGKVTLINAKGDWEKLRKVLRRKD